MMFDVAQLIAFLATLAAFGYYIYLIGKLKGFLKAIEDLLKESEREK